MAKTFTKNLPHRLVDAITYARRHRAKILQPVGNAVVPQYHALFDRVYAAHATEKFAGMTVNQITANDWRVLFLYKMTTRHNFDLDATLAKIAYAREWASKNPGAKEEDGWAVSPQERQADRQRALIDMRTDMLTWSDERLQAFAGLSDETAQFVRSISQLDRNTIVEDWHAREPDFLPVDDPFGRPYDITVRSHRAPLVVEQSRKRYDQRAMYTPKIGAKTLVSELAKLPAATITDLFGHYGADSFDRRNGKARGSNRPRLLAACIIAAEGAKFGASYVCSPLLVKRALVYV